MSEPTRVRHPKEHLLSTDVEGFDSLAELALDMRSSWNHATDQVWRQLDPVLWELTHNPWVVLQTVSRDKIQRVLADPAFRKNIDDLVQARRDAADSARVVSANPSAIAAELRRVFQHGIHVERSVADLFGRAWQRGRRSAQGRQRSGRAGGRRGAALPARLFPPGDRPGRGATGALSLQRSRTIADHAVAHRRTASGCAWRSNLPGYSVWLRAWQVQVGRVKLYLLDSNDAANFPASSRDHQRALRRRAGAAPQAGAVLGIGGWRLLAALGIEPEVCHLNEGHAAFAVLERARSFMQATGQPFEVALAATRAGNLFTTHTAVAAGFDRFAPASSSNTSAVCPGELGIHLTICWPWAAEPERLVGEFQHGVSGDPRERGGQWREPPAREVSRHSLSRCFRAGRRTKCRSDT